jgi:hypothetical protein
MKVKNYLLQMLNQFIPVVLGVYLGIVASNWNENRVKKAEQNEFIQNLTLEIQANKSKLEEALAYRQNMFLTGKKIRKELGQQKMEAKFWSVGGWNLVPEWEGLQIPTLENSVHQTGITTNALSGLEFKIINSISSAYNYQEDYKIWTHKLIFDNITQISSETKTEEALNKLEAWNDVIHMEQVLIKQYDQTLEELSKLNLE